MEEPGNTERGDGELLFKTLYLKHGDNMDRYKHSGRKTLTITYRKHGAEQTI